MTKTVQVRVLGREYSLRSQQSLEQVQRVAAFVESQLAEIGSVRSADTTDLTVLALLNLAGQYLQLQDRLAEEKRDQQQRFEVLLGRLQQVLVD